MTDDTATVPGPRLSDEDYDVVFVELSARLDRLDESELAPALARLALLLLRRQQTVGDALTAIERAIPS